MNSHFMSYDKIIFFFKDIKYLINSIKFIFEGVPIINDKKFHNIYKKIECRTWFRGAENELYNNRKFNGFTYRNIKF